MQDNNLIPVIRLSQWLEAWGDYDFDIPAQRRRPDPNIYLFGMAATKLRHLSNVYRRERSPKSVEGIQREQTISRTTRIKQYIKYGYPFGDLKPSLRSGNRDLRKPGWLPTAIVVNILTSRDQRRKRTITDDHMAEMIEHDGNYYLRLPTKDNFGDDDLRPFEVIDGQHRLWAFDDDSDELNSFEVPVVAFLGLDVAWQAYLFWSINITPRRINPSHAFDLYPLLRAQDWLEKTGEITVYREARAQEITEWLYRYPTSAWHDRISMLQRRGEPRVSQAAWVRSLIGSFFSTGRGKGRRGLFQCAYNEDERRILNWERVQQIAFIAEFWSMLKQSVDKGGHKWIAMYREEGRDAFTDRSSMLNQDMGVRAVHVALNDIFFRQAEAWKLDEWDFGIIDKTTTTEEDIEAAVSSLRKTPVHDHLKRTAQAIAGFDWRSLYGPNVKSSGDEIKKRAYRGSGGYTILREHVLEHMSQSDSQDVAETAADLLRSP